MNFVTKKHLPRRTILRGLGASIALPFLDSMLPAQTPVAKSAASSRSRLSCIYVPHGATMDKWTPASEGAGFQFTEILTPLEKFRDRLCVISDLGHANAAGIGSDAGADHARSAAVYLSGAHPEKDSIRVGATIDQIAAQHIGQDTPLPSMELSIEEVAISCGSGLCVRVFEHNFLEDADDAASDGKQPAGGVREVVRRRQHQCRSFGSAPAKPQSPGLGHAGSRVASKGTPRQRPSKVSRLSR